MQLGDVMYWLYTVTGVVGVFVAGAVIFRALEIRSVSVGAVYRRRALGSAALMIFAILADVTSPNTGLTSAPFFNTPIGSALTTLPLLLLFFAFYAFVDSNVLAAMEIDFFHRNTLRWRQVRAPFYGLMVLVLAILIAFAYYNTNSFGYSFDTLVWIGSAFGILGLVLGYSAVALVLVSRNTPDSTLKRFVRLVGVGLILFLVSSTIWVLDALVSYLGDAIAGLFIVAATYALYRAIMSLSPVGKLKEFEAK